MKDFDAFRREPQFYEAECMGKTSYTSKAKAIERIEHQARDHRRKRTRRLGPCKVKLVAYRCPHCHEWHVGGTAR